MANIRSVVFLTYHFPPEVGGIQTRIGKYIDRLAKRGIRVKVLVAGRRPAVQPRASMMQTSSPVREECAAFQAAAFLLANSIIESRADVVHVFTGSSTLLGVCALILAKVTGARPVISLFGREDFEFNSVFPRVLFRVSTALADSIDVNSTATRCLLPEKLKPKVHVLLGAAEAVPSPSAGAQGPPTVLFVDAYREEGRGRPPTGVTTVRSRLPQARLTIVGDGPEMKDLVELAQKLDLSDKCRFQGDTHRTEARSGV